MSDISMCGNEKCSIKRKCYRYMAEPNGWQSYAKFEGGKKCKGFIKYKGQREKRVKLIRDQITMEEYQEKMSEIIKKGAPVSATLIEMLEKASQYEISGKKEESKVRGEE